jgi:hypothetical protein
VDARKSRQLYTQGPGQADTGGGWMPHSRPHGQICDSAYDPLDECRILERPWQACGQKPFSLKFIKPVFIQTLNPIRS